MGKVQVTGRRIPQLFSSLMMAMSLWGGTWVPACWGQVTFSIKDSNDWIITDDGISMDYNPSQQQIGDLTFNGSGYLLNGNIDAEYAGTPYGTGPQTFNYQLGPKDGNGYAYVDVWTTNASTGSSVNPLTYAFHYVVFANDPTVYCYDAVSHAATDPATSIGAGEFLFRSNTAYFQNLYQVATGPNNLGPQTITNIASANANYAADTAEAGRTVQNVTYDLSGSGISSTSSIGGTSSGDNGTNFFTKYDTGVYQQFYQAETIYGSQYAVTNVMPSEESCLDGPTHQMGGVTDPLLLDQSFATDHDGLDSSSYTGDPGDALQWSAGQVASKVFGPFGFRISSDTSQTPSQINQAAINAIPNDDAEFATDTELAANGYIPDNEPGAAPLRGTVQINASNSATYSTSATGMIAANGWSPNSDNNTVVLSQNNVNFQETSAGYCYWGQLSQSGNVTLNNVVPGTYRLSLYELGQWGTTVYNNVVVGGLASDGVHGTITVPGYGSTPGAGLKFVPENFGTAPPIWTIGSPDRSDNEFTNGHDSSYNPGSSGPDLRQYYGAYNYWAEEAAMGNPGTVVYYATAVGSTPATNDPNAWIGNQWLKFNPPLFDPVNSTTDYYTSSNNPNVGSSAKSNEVNNGTDFGEPAYVESGGGAASYEGTPWSVRFTCTQAQLNQGQYVVLSVGAAALKSDLTVSLNGHADAQWTNEESGTDDASLRSSDSAFYQWAAFQFPTSDLFAAGSLNTFTFAVSSGDGVMYDALRMEITNTSANPATTGWYDYEYITATSQTFQNDAIGLTPNDLVDVPEPGGLILAGLSIPLILRRRRSAPVHNAPAT
ncbi:MAG: polysaccharide lyase family protein [Tepidisphaeraceae bacterium]